MHYKDGLFKAAEDESLDPLERSRAVEFLAIVDDPLAKKIVSKCLASPHQLVREAAVIAAMTQWDYDIFNSVSSLSEDETEIGSIRETCRETLMAWRETSLEVVQRYQKIRNLKLKELQGPKKKYKKCRPRTEEQKQKYCEAATRRKYRNNRPPGSYLHTEQTKEKIRKSNLLAYRTLPEKWKNACVDNEKWFESLSKSSRRIKTQDHLRKIVEAKVGMSYEEWEQVRGAQQSYAAAVRTITEKQPLHEMENHDLRGKGYDLDHIFSISEGFRLGVDPEIIGDITNLRFIPSKENQQKNKKCDVSLEKLMESYNARAR